LLSDPERARAMGERGRQIVERKFSCEAQVKQVEKLYDRMLAAKTPALPQALKSAQREVV